MCAEAVGRERAEKCPSQVGPLGHQVGCSGEIPQAKADLATFPGFQGLLGALARSGREGEPRLQLGAYRRRKERIGVTSPREGIIETQPSRDRPVQARRELSGPRDDDHEVATESQQEERAFHADAPPVGPCIRSTVSRWPARSAEPCRASP